jgi:hypothetical protein
MVSKKFFLGMLIAVLAFGMTLVGCEEETEPGEVSITNRTTFNITKVVFETNGKKVEKSDTSGISPSQEKTYKFDSDFDGKLIVTVSVDSESVNVEYKNLSVGPGMTNTCVFSLEGANKEALKLNRSN